MNNKSSFTRTFLLRLIFPATLYLLCSNIAQAQNLADFALGGRNICVIDVDGNLQCTTRFDADTHLPPADGTLYQSVSSGVNHSCAITQAGEIRCWGVNNFGQLDAPSSNARFLSLSASGNHTCAVDGNMQAHCWGLNTAGQTDVPEPNSGFVSVHTSQGSSCGLKESGELVCWTTDTNITDDLPENPAYIDVALAQGGPSQQSCGLTQEGLIDCWSSSPLSPPLPTNGPFTQIASNEAWFCALTVDGIADCNFRTIGAPAIDNPNQTLFNQVTALPALSSIQILTQSSTITSMCGLTLDGTLVCIGSALPANTLPGNQENPLTDIPSVENVRFDNYSDTTGELFWDPGSNLFSRFAGFNIYRDDELLAFTNNNSSFLDNTLDVGQEYVYNVALVDFAGFEGPLSAPIFVTAGNPGQDGTNTDINPSPGQPTNLSVTRYGDSSLEIFWDRPAFSIPDLRYQIFRNGEFLAIAPGPSYFDESVNPDTDYFYTIVAVERAGDGIFGVGFVNETAINSDE